MPMPALLLPLLLVDPLAPLDAEVPHSTLAARPLDALGPVVPLCDGAAPLASEEVLDGPDAPGGQSVSAPDAELPAEPRDAVAPDVGGVFGSTELPLPMVRELTPEVPVVADCAEATPAAAISANQSVIDKRFLIFPP